MDLKRIVAKGIKTIFNPAALTNCQVNKNAKICSGTQMNNSSINRYSYCGHDCFILNCDIGSFVSIADNCRLGGAMHPIERVSSSPVFHKGKNVLNKNFAKFDDISDKKIVINSDVWIGAGVTVLSGITIGVGALSHMIFHHMKYGLEILQKKLEIGLMKKQVKSYCKQLGGNGAMKK